MAPLPPGFQLEKKAGAALPPGFQIERAPPAPTTEQLYAKPSFDPALSVPGDGQGYEGALQAASQASQLSGGPGPELRAPQDDPARALDIALQGQRRGLASIPGSFVDLTNAGMNFALMGADGLADMAGNPMGIDIPARMSPRPAFGTDFNTDIIESVIPGDPYKVEEMTPAQRIGYEANNMAAATIVPSTMLNRMAVNNVAQTVKSPLLESLTRNANPVSDTVAATGAGSAYGAYESMVPEDIKQTLGPLGQIIASLGGASGANLLENLATGGTRGVIAALNKAWTGGVDTSIAPNADGSFVNAKDADLAALAVQGQAANPQRAAQSIADKTTELAPYASKSAMPTAGVLSDDPGLVAMEKSQRQSPELFTDFATRDQATERAALTNARQIAPEAANGRQFTDTIEQQHNARVDAARGALDNVSAEQAQLDAMMAQRAAAVAAPRGTKPSASQRLDEAVVPRLTAAQQAKNDAFDAIDPTGQVQRPVDPLMDAVNDIEANTGALSSPAGQPKQLMDQIKTLADPEAGPGTISFQDLNTARIDISSQIASARAAGNYTLADNLARIRNTISGEAERLAAEGGEAGVRAQQAMQEYQRFAEVWNRGPGDPATQFRKDFNLDRQNRTVTPPSQTAERFLQPGQPEKVASLKRIVGDSPDGARAAGDFLSADLADSGVIRNGRIDPNAVRSWVAKWGNDAIGLSPEFRRQIDDLLKSSDMDAADATILGRQLREAEKELATQQRDSDAVRKVLGNDPTNAVANIFKSGDPERTTREILGQIGGNESARNGLRAAVREYVLERATNAGISRTGDGSNPLSFAKLDQLFKENEGVLAEIFTPEQMNYLRASHQLLAPLKNLEMKTVPGSQTSQNERLWESISKPLEVGLKLRFGVLKGGGLMRTVGLWRQMLPNGDKAAQELIARMYFDPELAQHLLTRKVSEVGSAPYNKKLIRLLTYGKVAGDAMADGEEKKEPLDITVGYGP